MGQTRQQQTIADWVLQAMQAYNGLGVTEKPHLGPGWLDRGGFLFLPEPNTLHPRIQAFLPQHLPSSAMYFPYMA